MNKLLIIFLFLLSATTAGTYVLIHHHAPSQTKISTGQISLTLKSLGPLPAFSLPDLHGQIRHHSEWHGKITIINFWATWCPPCVKEIPMFMELQRTYSEKGIQLIGIALDDPENVQRFAARLKINYPILLGEDLGIAVAKRLGNQMGGLPFTTVVDQHGQMVLQYLGELEDMVIKQIIHSLL